jgi:uncharacterized protein (TIGR02678 family)
VIADDAAWQVPTAAVPPLAPDAATVAAALLQRPLLTVEHDADLFADAIDHADQLKGWFAHVAGWRLTTHPHEGFVRLRKRRGVPPIGRPALSGRGRPASKLVLTVVALVCEQLWRRPEMAYTELQRAITGVCATESKAGLLPDFHPVDRAGDQHARANNYRLALIEALQLLEDWHVISSSDPLEVAIQDHHADMVITARRERLNALLVCPSPSMLPIDLHDPDSHVRILCADESDLSEQTPLERRAERRRHTAMRLVLDEPVIAVEADTEDTRFLDTLHGRRFARQAAEALGLTCTVRPGWWLVADPEGMSTDTDFPVGRTHEQQAALILLKEITERPNPDRPVALEDAEQWLNRWRAQAPWWAATRCNKPGGTRRLARIGAVILTDLGLLSDPLPDVWQPTGAAAFWQVEVVLAQSSEVPQDPDNACTDAEELNDDADF